MKTGTLLAALLLIPATLMAGALETAYLSNGAEYLVDRFIVTTRIGTPFLEIDNAVSGTAFTGVESIDNLCAQNNVVRVEMFYDGPVKSPGLKDLIPRMYIFHVAAGTNVIAAKNAFRDCVDIETSDLYDIPKPTYEPNDPSHSSQWHLNKVQAYEAWDIIRGNETQAAIVSIVDTGVYWMHPDLAPNMWINGPEDLNGNGTMDSEDFNGVDDDGNGYVDDVIGWDNGANDNDPREEYPYHGTHVAGCASEATDNELMGAGIGFSARIMANKGANTNGQLTAVYQAMVWASENGAHIINCSWGSRSYNSNYQNIINGIWDNGGIVVASAGNDDWARPYTLYPGAYNNVVAVAATNQSDHMASFSNWGTWVDVSAPGLQLYSTWATGSMASLSGTSMSSPVTAGVCALLKAANRDWTNEDIVNALITSADYIDDINPDYAGMLGSGRVNAYAALASSNTPNIQAVEQAITITDDDGDGILNPGESFELVITLENIWADAANVMGTLHGSGIFSVSDSVASFGDIPHDGSSDNADSPYLLVSDEDAIPDESILILNIQADDDYEADRDITITLSLDQSGFPLELSGNVESSPLIFDFDMDGENELIIGTSDDRVYAIEADGSNSPGWPQSVSGDVVSGPAVGDLAASGSFQIVAITKTGMIYAWDDDGSLLPNFPVDKGGDFYSGAMLIDLDGDDDLEIVAGSFSDYNIYVLNHDGSDYPGWPFTGDNRWYGSPSSGDLDGDGLSEIIYAGFDSHVHAFDADGSYVDGFPVQLDNAIRSAVSVGDVDGDTYLEIAAVSWPGSLYLINHDGTIADDFPVSIGSNVQSAPSMADMDGDGTPEIILGANGRTVHVIDADGSELAGFPVEIGGSITASVVVGDITGDGEPDIVVGAGDGIIYGYDADGHTIRNFPIPGSTTGQIRATAALGDLDSDGDMEIAIGISTIGANLMVIDYKENASPADLQWANFGKDIWRSNDFSGVVTGVDGVPEIPAEFGLSQNYPNPFNARTTIHFTLASPGEVTLSVYDLLGRRIKALQSGFLNAGAHGIVWDGANESGKIVSSGIYFYRLESPEGSRTMRMVLLK